MTLNSSVVLAIINLIFYIPVLPIALYVCARHGLKRSSGWIFLLLLSLIRVIGEPMVIASNGGSSSGSSAADPNDGLAKAGLVLSGVGLTPLILIPVGLLAGVNSAMAAGTSSGRQRAPVPAPVFTAMHVPATAAIALFIAGTTGASGTDATPQQLATANTERVAAGALFVLAWAAVALLTAAVVVFARRRRLTPGGEDCVAGGATGPVVVVLRAVVVMLPFLALRILATCLTAFAPQKVDANNVYLRVFLVSIMEWIIVLVAVVAGLRAGPLPRATRAATVATNTHVSPVGSYGQNTGVLAGNGHPGGNSGNSSNEAYPLQQQQQQQQHVGYPGHIDQASYYSEARVQERQDRRNWQTQYNGLGDLYEMADKLGERLQERIERKVDRRSRRSRR